MTKVSDRLDVFKYSSLNQSLPVNDALFVPVMRREPVSDTR